MMKNSKLKFSEYMQNITRSKTFGKFALIVLVKYLANSIFRISISLHRILLLQVFGYFWPKKRIIEINNPKTH